QITGGDILEQIRPRQHAEQAAFDQPAAFGAMAVQKPAERLQLFPVQRAINQANIIPPEWRRLEPALRTLVKRARQPYPFGTFPLQLDGRETVTDGIEHIEEQRFEFRQILK